jgi:cytochrome P450
MLLLLSTFVRRYDFELVRPDEVEIAPKMITHPKGPIEMNIRRP